MNFFASPDSKTLLLFLLFFVNGVCLHLDTAEVASAATAGGTVRFLAHRGESAIAPENTQIAFDLAWKNGSSYGIELDIVPTKDGELVCSHDENLLHTTGKNIEIPQTNWNELKDVDVGSLLKGDAYKQVRLPLLKNVLRQIPPGGNVVIELKSRINVPDQIKKIDEYRQEANLKVEQIKIVSFNANSLNWIENNYPQYQTILAVEPGRTAEELIAYLHEFKIDGTTMGGVYAYDANYIQKLKTANIYLIVWTLDDLDSVLYALSIGFEEITTNCPTALKTKLEKHNPQIKIETITSAQ